MTPPFWGRNPTGGVGDLPLSAPERRGESIVEEQESRIRGRVDDRVREDECFDDQTTALARGEVVVVREGIVLRSKRCDTVIFNA